MAVTYTTGDILRADAHCLINTVNCEGYMGKGIAYQFKLEFPENNQSYVSACRSGKLVPGTLHCFSEKGKLIVNFPTKNRWRENSRMEYIQLGLNELRRLIREKGIQSVAVPPLGCGNGGLDWEQVRPVIEERLANLPCDVVIYQPLAGNQRVGRVKVLKAPRMSTAHLIVMLLGQKLRPQRLTRLRLQKAAYLMNLFAKEDYFKFDAHKLGPYCHALDILIRQIREFQSYHNATGEEAMRLAERVLVSESVIRKVKALSPAIERSAELVNSVQSDGELELLSSILYLLSTKSPAGEAELIEGIQGWSQEKRDKFSADKVRDGLQRALERGLVSRDLTETYRVEVAAGH